MGTILMQIAKAVLAAKAQGKLVGLLGSKTAGGVALTAGATEMWAPLAVWALGLAGLPITSAEGVHVVELVFQAGGAVLALYGYLHARWRANRVPEPSPGSRNPAHRRCGVPAPP